MPAITAGAIPVPGVPGVYRQEAAVLTPEVISFLTRLRSILGWDFVVSSGLRSPEAQAAAMFRKFQLGGLAELHKVYSNDSEITKMVQDYGPTPTLEGFKQAVRDQVARGIIMSKHMRNDAVDINVGGLTPAEQQAILTASFAAGARQAFIEGNPAHIHVDGFSGSTSLLPVSTKSVFLGVAGGAVAGSALLAAFYFWWRRRRR